MDEAPAQPPQRSNTVALLLVVLAIGGSAVGVFFYQSAQSNRKTNIDASGFDIAQTTDKPAVAGASSQQIAPTDSSSLGMIKTGLGQMKFGINAGGQGTGTAQSPAEATKKAADTFGELCVKNEAKVRAFAEQWTKRSPTLQQYGKEWMSYPDLKQLNDNYMRYHDPIAFMRGLAESPKFPKLVTKYATKPDMQQIVQQGMKQVPPELTNAGMAYVNKDGIVKKLVSSVMESLGLPAGMLGGGDAPAQVDASKIMGSVMGNNPQLQKAMENNPEIQQKMKDATSGAAGQQPR